MKHLKLIFYSTILVTSAYMLSSCSLGNKNKQDKSEGQEQLEMMKENKDHIEGNGEQAQSDTPGKQHNAGQGEMMDMKTGGNKTWTPDGNGPELIKEDFHFMTGSIENINPEVKKVEESPVLELTADGTPTAFVFHNQYGNVGMIATLQNVDFKGTIKLIHHAKDMANYEFVAASENNMKLGRVVNGNEKVFDESKFDVPTGWMPLKVTAAGTHYKGYIGDKAITHGHSDKMDDGFIGLMLDGKGTIQVKSIEVAVLEDE
jgi:hypothetical protein